MARLPQPGGDNGNWGTILNEYLSQAHKSDGTLKNNVVGTAQLQDDAVTTASVADGAITETLLSSPVQTKLNQAAPTWSTLSGKPTVIAAGADQAAARNAVQALGLIEAAKSPELLFSGSITRNSDNAITSAAVVWPDGTVGTFTTTSLSTSFPGAIDAYNITYGSPVTKTFSQPAVTRNSNGGTVNVPGIVVS